MHKAWRRLDRVILPSRGASDRSPIMPTATMSQPKLSWHRTLACSNVSLLNVAGDASISATQVIFAITASPLIFLEQTGTVFHSGFSTGLCFTSLRTLSSHRFSSGSHSRLRVACLNCRLGFLVRHLGFLALGVLVDGFLIVVRQLGRFF